MIFEFRKEKVFDPFNSPILLDGDAIEMVYSYRYLGAEIGDHLNWGGGGGGRGQTKAVSLQCNRKLYFLCKLKQFHVNERIIWLFLRICDSEYNYPVTIMLCGITMLGIRTQISYTE